MSNRNPVPPFPPSSFPSNGDPEAKELQLYDRSSPHGAHQRGAIYRGAQRGVTPPVSLNIENMVSLLFELRGQVSHEIEARKQVESQLQDVRFHLSDLRSLSTRENNKWSNLLTRVKELEMGMRMDNKLLEMNSKNSSYEFKQDKNKIFQVFSDFKNRLDTQERLLQTELMKLSRDNEGDTKKLESDIKQYIDNMSHKQEMKLISENEEVRILKDRLINLEKEFQMFMNAQVLQRQNEANKEKDGDWLKLYLMENFNTLKQEMSGQFSADAQSIDKLKEQIKSLQDQLKEQQDAKVEISDDILRERDSRSNAVKKLQKAIKQSTTNIHDNIKTLVTTLENKSTELITNTTNQATAMNATITALQSKLETHIRAFDDAQNSNNDMMAREHDLETKVKGLEEVLRAEIKSRIKNHQKNRVSIQEIDKKIEALKLWLSEQEKQKFQLEQQQRAEEAEHAKLLHIAMETRSVLDGMIGQVEDHHYAEVRKNEWKAFGGVIEAELNNRDSHLEAKIAAFGDNTIKGRIETIEKHLIHSAQVEEENAHMLYIAMETKACLDSMVLVVEGREEAKEKREELMELEQLRSNIHLNFKNLEERLIISEDTVYAHGETLTSIKQFLESEHDTTAVQLRQTHQEIVNLTQELAKQVDEHTGELDEIHAINEQVAKQLVVVQQNLEDVADTLHVHEKDITQSKAVVYEVQDRIDQQMLNIQKSQVSSEMADRVELMNRDVKLVKNTIEDVKDYIENHNNQLKIINGNINDLSISTQSQRMEIETKLNMKLSEHISNLETRVSRQQAKMEDDRRAKESSNARVEDIASIVRKIESMDHTQGELIASQEQIIAKTQKQDAQFQQLLVHVDDTTTIHDKHIKEMKAAIENGFEDQDIINKKLEKNMNVLTDDVDRIHDEFNGKIPQIVAALKAHDDMLDTLSRSSGGNVNVVQDRLDNLNNQLKTQLKEIHTALDETVHNDQYLKDYKNWNEKYNSLEDLILHESKAHKTAIADLSADQEHTAKQIQRRFSELESAGGAKTDEGGRRLIDATSVERHLESLADDVTAVNRRLKDNAAVQEENTTKVTSQLKSVMTRLEHLENDHDDTKYQGDGNISRKQYADLQERVDIIENEVKIKTVGGMNSRLDEIQTKTDFKMKEVQEKLIEIELRQHKAEQISSGQELKALTTRVDEADQKHTKQIKDIKQEILELEQIVHDAKSENKLSLTSYNIDNEEQHKQIEQRLNSHINTLRKDLETALADEKAATRKLQDQLHDVQYEMKYAMDAAFPKGINVNSTT